MRRSWTSFFLRKKLSQSIACRDVWTFVTLFKAKPIAIGKSIAHIMSIIAFPVFRELIIPIVWMLSSPLPSPKRSILNARLALRSFNIYMFNLYVRKCCSRYFYDSYYGRGRLQLYHEAMFLVVLLLINYRKLSEFRGST